MNRLSTRRHLRGPGRLAALLLIAAVLLTGGAASAQCSLYAGGQLCAVMIRSNPIGEMFASGTLESWVTDSREDWATDGEVVRCGRVISEALIQQAIAEYNPEWQEAQDALRVQMEAITGQPGPISPVSRSG